jgi:hypothetical protein
MRAGGGRARDHAPARAESAGASTRTTAPLSDRNVKRAEALRRRRALQARKERLMPAEPQVRAQCSEHFCCSFLHKSCAVRAGSGSKETWAAPKTATF